MTERMGIICSSTTKSSHDITGLPTVNVREDVANRSVPPRVTSKGSSNKAYVTEQERKPTRLTPSPQTKRKYDIFKPEDYQYVADHVAKASKQLLMAPFGKLVYYLTSNNNWNDVAKVRAIFLWVTSIDIDNIHIDGIPPFDSAMQYIVKIQKNIGSHARLFYGLCQMAYISCMIINGMTKSCAYKIGMNVDREKMGSQWNAVYLEDGWWFIDVLWASHIVAERNCSELDLVQSFISTEEDGMEGLRPFNEFYFMPDSDKFIYTHFPDEEQWQLLKRPITVKEFEEYFYVRERFHTLRMMLTPDSHKNATVNTSDGEIKFCFSLPKKDSRHYRFRYMLYKPNNCKCQNFKMDFMPLERYVFFEHTSKMVSYTLRLPIKGTFQMDIYALDIRESDIFDIVCSYLIECPIPSSNIMPFPDNPKIGWGPGSTISQAGLIPVSHNEAIILTNDGKVQIRFSAKTTKPGVKIDVYTDLNHCAIDGAILTKYAVVRHDGNDVVISLRLPLVGEYALKICAHKSNMTGQAPTVCYYLIKCQGTVPDGEHFPNIAKGILGKHHLAVMFGVSAQSHLDDVVEATDGKVSVTFSAPQTTILICELHTNDPLAERTMAIAQKNENGQWTFDVDLPKAGEYSLNVFAKSYDDTTRLNSVHAYLVTSTGQPDFTDNITQNDGHQNIAVTATETVDTSENEFMIPLRSNIMKPNAELYKGNSKDTASTNEIEIITKEDMEMVHIQLKEYGTYIVNLYDTDNNGNIKNVARYQIKRKRPGELYRSNAASIVGILLDMGMNLPSNVLRETEEENANKTNDQIIDETLRLIERAISLQCEQLLQQTIKTYRRIDPLNKVTFLNQANEELDIIQAKMALREACQFRKLTGLNAALITARNVNTGHQLDMHIAVASKLKIHLSKIAKLVHAVVHIDRETITKIKHYSLPPEGVHKVMMATFLLLGSKLSELQNWIEILILMGKIGNESLQKKVCSFDPQNVHLLVAHAAQKLIEDITLESINNANTGVGIFYLWVKHMIDEVQSFGGLENSTKCFKYKISH